MCLITTQTAPLIAEEDMIVCKILWADHRSLQFRTLYEEGKLYTAPIEIDKKNSVYYKGKQVFGPGLHAWNIELAASIIADNLLIYTESKGYRIHKAVIPKGSEYYIGKIGLDIVSNQLIVYGAVSSMEDFK